MRHGTLQNVSVELLRAIICRGEGAVHAVEHRMEERREGSSPALFEFPDQTIPDLSLEFIATDTFFL